MNELQLLKKLEYKIEILQNEILEITSLSVGISEVKVQTSLSGDKLENMVIKIIEIKEEYYEKINNYMRMRKLIINKIMSVENELYSKILYLRYIKDYSIVEISDELGYTYRWTQTLVKRALKAYQSL